MIITKLQRFVSIRQIHTIISQQTIKPSSPTPSHLTLHKLSLIDYFAQHIHMPLIFFYQNYKNVDTNILKKSLSQCLTHYYPFAGRFVSPTSHHIDCNDQGVEFWEASIDSRLDDFIFKKEQDKTLDQLIPNGCIGKTSPNMLEVQLNHFTCGGVAVTVSASHKIADAFTVLNLCNHWATLTHGGSSNINPSFLNLSLSNFQMPEFKFMEAYKVEYASNIFVFPNSKLNKLKKKINDMGTNPVDATRVESLTSLIYKCAVGAATAKSGSLHPSNLCQAVNLRNKISIQLPKLMAGNLSLMVYPKTGDSGQIELNRMIKNLRKEIMGLQEVTDVKGIGELLAKSVTMFTNGRPTYMFTSMCRLPFYQVDFGWGVPVRVVLRTVNPGNYIMLMDTPSGDGIEATVQLEKDEMAIFENDQELLAYAQNC
ncbi:hypothetical protein QVD17_13674 [Tagetes erecta]|uniref:Transferase, Chloramphenicol acetyltransferase-like domain protein n=1 Tax=Tagetes erecta TaxID=13708 RepID=A0AAD8KW43_TARER|nr:hypothetical protein QVD17_13674 [Tagetes erecta]